MTSVATQVDRYWHTIRYLRPTQILGRLWFRTMRPLPRLGPAPPVRPSFEGWALPARRSPSQLGPDTFTFLNEMHTLGPKGWDDPMLSPLWRYNLHYFDDLNAHDSAQRATWHASLIERWIFENPPDVSKSGWEPYPLSLPHRELD